MATTFFVIFRGPSIEEAGPLAVCTNPKTISKVAELLIEDTPTTETNDQFKDHLRPHDLRHTAKTHLRKLGISNDVCDKIFNHKTSSNSVSSRYDHYDAIKEKRSALETWSRHILESVSQ